MLIERNRDKDGKFADGYAEFLARFNASVQKTDACWLWTGAKTLGGYGLMRYMGRTTGTHRASYSYFIGPIPQSLLVLHRCDVRNCVNPQHLFLGTHADNYHDCASKQRTIIGEKSPRAKFSDAQVAEIRSQKSAGIRASEIAIRFGISIRHVYQLANRECRKD